MVEILPETHRVDSLVLDVPDWPGHRPGQHVDVRLTAEDGYQAQRSYSVAAPADGKRVVLTVERLEDGEVSPFLVDDLRPSATASSYAGRSAATSSGTGRRAGRSTSSPAAPASCP